MDQLLVEALKNSPALLAMIILVLIFLKHEKALIDSHAKRTDEFISVVKEMKDGDRQIILDNTSAGKSNTESLLKLTNEICRISDRLVNRT